MSSLDVLVGSSAPMMALRTQVERLMARPGPGGRLPPVLVLGETGTGKGFLVRIVHQASARRDMPLIEINCAAIPENLVEAELFGFERGAFTDARQAKPGLFQAAHRGVLFLDEVGSLPRPVQAKLLTALEQREVRRLGSTRTEPVDVWIFSATNEDLAAGVARHEFRLDLYHRISAFTVQMPPLRARGRDVIALARHYLERASADYGLPPRRLTADAEDALLAHAWPGNVRELVNLMERAVLLADTEEITAEHLELPPPPGRPEPSGEASGQRSDMDPGTLRATLEATQWNLSRAAARLGVPRNTLRYRIERLGLRPGVAAPTPSAEAPGPAAVRGAPPPRLRWEQRFITGLLIDLEPPPSVSGFHLTPLVDELIRKVESFGGHLEELHPLGFTALFGHEPAEDAPSRAALAGQAVQKAVEAARDIDGQTVTLRVALHILQGLIARGALTGGMDLGDRARLRHALASLAASPPAGAIVVSAEAARFLERRFVLDPLAGHPQLAFRLVGPSRSGFDLPGGARSPFFGRDREISQLDDLLAEAERGRGQLAGLVGEPGVGKSRLLHEFRQSLGPERVRYLEGRGAPHGTHTPYLPIVQLLRDAFVFSEADEPAGVARKVRMGVAAMGLEVEAVAPYLLHLLGVREDAGDGLARLTPEAVRQRTLEALRQTIIAASQQRPVIIAIEDLQWVDATSADSLMALAESAAASRILMLTTYRQGYQPAWLGRSYATQLVVRRLSPRDASRIVEAMAPGVVSPDIAAALVTKADGIPFFLEELVRSVRESGTGGAVGIPATIQGVITARLDRLPAAGRELLEVAAVLGKEGAVALLRETSGLSDPEFSSALTHLRVGEFLREHRVVPAPEYGFTHVLTHEVAYQGLTAERKRALHGAAAAAIERLFPQTASIMPEVLAHHLTEAGSVAPAIGQWHRAGRMAIQRSANAEAVIHLTRALSLIETEPEGTERAAQELTVRLSLVTALSATRGYAAPELEASVARARTLLETLPESPQTFVLRWNLWRFYVSRADFRAAEAMAARLLAAVAHGADPPAMRNAHVAAGVNKFYLGELGAARDHLDEALRLSQAASSAQQIAFDGQDTGIAARGFLAWTLALMGDLAAAAREAAAALAAARALGHPFSLALSLLAAGEVHQLRRDAAAVAPLGRELLDLSREHSFVFFTAFGLMFSGWASAASGSPHEGLETMRQGADLFRSVGQRLGLAHRAHLAEVLIAQGAFDEGLTVVDEALQQSDATGEGAFVAELHRLRGEVFRQTARPKDADVSFRHALAVATGQGAWLFALRAAADLIRLGDTTASSAAADREALQAIVSRFPSGVEWTDLAFARALLQRAR